MALVKKLTGNMPKQANYDERPHLEALAATPQDNPPDWTRWWLNVKEHHLHLRREGKKTSPERKLLQEASEALVSTAVANLPSTVAAAQGGRIKTLSELLSALSAMASALWSLDQHDAHKALYPALLDAEKIREEIVSSGVNIKLDAGIVTDLRSFKTEIGALTLDKINICLPERLWWNRNIDDGWRLMHNQQPQGHPQPRKVGPEEYKLMFQVAANHPVTESYRSTHKTANAVAYLTSTTPKHVTEYLSAGEPEDFQPLPRCSAAELCLTPCASAQTEGESPHPFTWDGKERSCGYWHFISVQHGSPPDVRERAAAAMLKTLRAKMKDSPEQSVADEEADNVRDEREQDPSRTTANHVRQTGAPPQARLL